MKAAVLIAILLGFSTPAFAKHRHHGHHRHHHLIAKRERGSHENGIYRCAGCVIRDTLAGAVAVSRENAERFVGVINDLVNAGFNGPVHCAAPYGTHVRNSRHYSGNACDFAQSGWGKTKPIMYHREAALIISKYGLTNGCSFRDCGHVGTDGDGHGHRYAAVHRRHYAYSRRRHYAEAQ
jgi:hypothetical protein